VRERTVLIERPLSDGQLKAHASGSRRDMITVASFGLDVVSEYATGAPQADQRSCRRTLALGAA
jgi:hypothetical protein